MSTKENIMEEAKKLFNKNGFNGVTLHELAQALGMSRGNLAYHYKDKEVLLAAIADEMWQKIELERSKSRQFPSFENLHNEVQMYYRYQKEYAFIFLDVHVSGHALIRERMQNMITQTVKDNKAAIAFSIKNGNMKQEAVPGLYHNLAFTVWMLAFYWLSQQIIRGEKTVEEGEKVIWSLLVPHFTEKGMESFTSFFGEEYVRSLGNDLEVELRDYISF